MIEESDIMHESGNFWVLSQQGAYTVFEARGVASYSVQSFAKDVDGLSCAVAYCDHKERRRNANQAH